MINDLTLYTAYNVAYAAYEMRHVERGGARDGWAIMQFNAIQAYMEEDEVIVLKKGMKPQCSSFDGSHLIDPLAPDARLSDIAVAHSTWASATYKNET